MLSSVIIGLVIIFLQWIVRRLLLLWRLPPGPWGLPFYGSGFQVDMGNLPELLTKWHRYYGDIFSFSLPIHQDVIVVSSHQLIHEVLVSRSAEFSGRPKSIRLDALWDNNTEVSFSDDTPHRMVLKKAVNVSLKLYIENQDAAAMSAIQEMMEKWKMQSGKIISPKDDISDLAYKIISSMVFQREFPQKDAECWTDITKRFVAGASERAQYLEHFPWIKHLPNADWKFLQDTHNDMISFINRQIRQRMEQFDGEHPECTLDAWILYQRKYNQENGANIITDKNIAYVMADLMGASLVTTHRKVYTILAILADSNHGDIVRRMQREIETNIGKETPRLADKHKLPYIEAVILESLRYWTYAPILIPHAATVDTTLAGFAVPKGTQIWPNIFNLAHDPRYWERDPWKFNPDNFLDENGDIVPPDHVNRKRMFQFGGGRRSCAGEALGKNRLFLIITSIVQNFELSPAPGKPKPNHDCRKNFVRGMFTMPEDYEILIRSRQD